jgi:glycosyltransferase involved in cell wall biosynthesis
MDSPTPRLTVLHYVGYDHDAGGILSAVRALASANRFDCVLGVNPGFRSSRQPELLQETLPQIEGERLSFKTFWRARSVARALEAWLRVDANRRLHLHSRAALAAGWWLRPEAVERAAISVHCLGKQKWFYRASARRFGQKLFWLHPAMRDYYGLHEGQLAQPSIDSTPSDAATWKQCVPSALTPLAGVHARVPTPATRARVRSDRLVVGGIGAIVQWKRWDLILDAIGTLDSATREKVIFRHLGANDGTASSRHYEAVLRAHAQSGFVRWDGAQPSSQPFLNEIDCLIVASDEEPLSLAMLEALRAGVPVLRADTGGGLDAIWPNQNGWLFRAGDASDLAAHLWRLIHTDALARTRYVPEAFERYLAPNVAEQWLRIYRAPGKGENGI